MQTIEKSRGMCQSTNDQNFSFISHLYQFICITIYGYTISGVIRFVVRGSVKIEMH